MTFIKVRDKNNEIIDLNPFLILKIEKYTDGIGFERAIITDILGNEYRSIISYEDFLKSI